MNEQAPEGWGPSIYGHKWHYFVDDRSLCGKYGWVAVVKEYLGVDGLQQGQDDSVDNCAACKRKLAARIMRQTRVREK